MKFSLKLFDKKLLVFEYYNTSFFGEKCDVLWIDKDNMILLPIGMQLSDNGILSWLSHRVIPKNREFVETILARMGLSSNDTMGIIKICKGLSLNDSYWVVEDGFDGKFDDYNLYENNFSRTLALIAYTGYGSVTAKGFTSSPEFTTSGMLKKCWRRIGGKIYLYKGGTSGAANAGNEPYSEYYAAQIAEKMGIKHVCYNLKKWKGMIASVCELFTNKNTAYVPIYKFIDKNGALQDVVTFLRSCSKEIYDDFVDMLIFDALIYNTDRHFGNFGLLVDSRTNEIIGFAPVFDNGMSLFNFAMDEDLKDLDKYSKTRYPAFGKSYEDVVKTFITDRQRAQLRKIINFHFKLHSRYNLPKNRLNIIEKHLQKRVRTLLDM